MTLDAILPFEPDECEPLEVAQPAPPDALIWHPPTMSLEDVTDLAAGIVPRWLQAMSRATLDFDDHCRRNADRPSHPKRS